VGYKEDTMKTPHDQFKYMKEKRPIVRDNLVRATRGIMFVFFPFFPEIVARQNDLIKFEKKKKKRIQ